MTDKKRMTEMEKKVPYISCLSVVSCLAVIFLHTNGCFWTFRTDRVWKTANVIECLAYFAVPCFFMISGATLIEFRERYSLKQYFTKRIQKTVIPFLVWSLIGLAYQIIVAKTVRTENLRPTFLYNGVMRTSFVGIYWFFTTLFCIYLCIPLFAAVEKSLRKETFSYLAIAGFVINSVIPFCIRLSGKDLAWPLSVQAVSGSLLYIPIGYLLHRYELSRKGRIILYALGVCGLLMHMAGTHILSMKAGSIVSTFKGYQNVPCVLYSVGIFTFFRYNAEKWMNRKPVQKTLLFLSGYSFAIYLMHWFIMDLFRRAFDIDTRLLAYRLGAPVLIAAVAVGIAFVMKKIPLIRKIVP